MASATIALACGRGEAVTFNCTHQTSASNTTAVDITGWTINVMARDDAGTAWLTKAASVTSGPAGTYSFSVTHSDTNIQPKTYQIDVWRTDSGNEKLMGVGTLEITSEVRYR